MRKPTCPQAVMLLTAITGVALVGLWRFNKPAQPVSDDTGVMKITDGSHSRVMAPDGRYMDMAIYKFSDNRPVTLIQQSHLPPEVAELDLQKLLEGDIDIIERAPVMSEKGERVGERVVALFYIYGREHIPHVFLWKQHGSSVYRIEGTSLEQVIVVERGLK